MNRPWDVVRKLQDLVDGMVNDAIGLTIEHVTKILDEDSPGTWIPDDVDRREALDRLNIEWADIEEIFEAEIEELINNEAAKRKHVMP